MTRQSWLFKISLLILILIAWWWCTRALSETVNTKITDMRIATIDNNSRFVFETTKRPEYILFTLENPNRLVLDIKNADINTRLNRPDLAKTPVKNFRMSHHSQDKFLRIVMDLKQPVKAKSFVLTPSDSFQYRLVIDLTPASMMTAARIATPNSPIMKQQVVAEKNNPAPVEEETLMPPSVASKSTPSAVPQQEVTPPSPPAPSPQVAPVVQSKPVVAAMPMSDRIKSRDIIIVIDPGHGGKDPGTIGKGGTREKDVVLAISQALQRSINEEPGFRAILTRNSDYYIPLRGRLDIARKDQADMFIAIHADAYQNDDALGASVFALSERGATSEAARWLAEKENRSELMGGVDLPDQDNILRSVLIDLSQTHTISVSLQIGNAILRQLSNVTQLHHNRVDQAAFVVLKSPDIPSMLVETGFLSTPQQERQLRNPQYQERLAGSIKEGIKSYFVRNPPQGSLYVGKSRYR